MAQHYVQMWPGSLTRRRTSGFTIAEVIVALLTSSVLLSVLFGGFVALLRSMHPQRLMIGGEVIPVAPTFACFPSAVRLHGILMDRVVPARAVYVFGGAHRSIPTNAPAALLQPLRVQTLPDFHDLSRGLPLDARSFYDLYAAELGPQETNPSPEDFTLLVLGVRDDALGATCLVQVRRSAATLDYDGVGVTWRVREVKLWDRDAGMLRYVFAESPATGAPTSIGATHTWIRYDASKGTGEEGPTCIAFPDPWLFRGRRQRPDDLPAFSRFTYFFAVSP